MNFLESVFDKSWEKWDHLLLFTCIHTFYYPAGRMHSDFSSYHLPLLLSLLSISISFLSEVLLRHISHLLHLGVFLASLRKELPFFSLLNVSIHTQLDLPPYFVLELNLTFYFMYVNFNFTLNIILSQYFH